MRSLRTRLATLLALVMALVVTAACGSDSQTAPSSPSSVPFSSTDLSVGTGVEATSGKTATVTYTGWLYSSTAAENKGSQFDTGTFSFVVGSNGVIQGFSVGVVGMKEGGRRRLIIPPNLGYGAAGAGSTIPPNATLVFDVGLTRVQ